MTDEEKINGEKPTKKRSKRRPRRRGSGSVFRRPDRKGKQWVAQIILEDGKTKQRYFNTQTAADEALNEMLYEQKRGMLITEKDQTVKQYLEHWIENVHKKAVRLSTYQEYRKLINIHIIPELGQFKLQQLTIQQVEAFYTHKENEGLSAGYIRQMHGILHQALAHAMRSNLVSRNVCDAVTLPRLKRHEIQPLSIEQAQKFLATVKGKRLEALFTTAILTGMREGELLALHWNDINFEQMYLQVHRTVRRITGQGNREDEPKTASSRRKIALSSFLIEVLKQHRIRQLENRLRLGTAWKDLDLVFCNTHGNFIDPASLRLTLRKALRDAGLSPMRFHDLRHSAATLLLAMGVHAKVVQELLGHSNIMTTLNIYSHVLPSLHENAMGKLSDLFDQQENQEKDDDAQQKK